MKTKRYGSIFNGLSLALFILWSIHASGQELDTTIIGTKPVGKDIVIYVRNHVGDVEVKTWNKDEVKIEYRFNLVARSKEEATAFYNALKGYISKQLNTTGTKLNVSYPFRNYVKNDNKVEIKLNSGDNKYLLKELKTNTIIYMPVFNMLEAHCNFCKLTIENLGANASLDINSCELITGNFKDLNLKASFSKNMIIGNVDRAEMDINSSSFKTGAIQSSLQLKSSFSSGVTGNIGKEAILDLNSSSFESGDIPVLNLKGSFIRNFIISRVNTAKISVNSSDLNFENISKLEVPDVSFSTLTVKSVDEVKINTSSSTTFSFDHVQSLESARCSFTNFNIWKLKDRFATNSNSGSNTIKNIMERFREISITGSFVTTAIQVAPESSFNLAADLTFPNYTFDKVTIQNREKDMNHEVLKGVKGNASQGSSLIQLNCQSCKITLK